MKQLRTCHGVCEQVIYKAKFLMKSWDESEPYMMNTSINVIQIPLFKSAAKTHEFAREVTACSSTFLLNYSLPLSYSHPSHAHHILFGTIDG